MMIRAAEVSDYPQLRELYTDAGWELSSPMARAHRFSDPTGVLLVAADPGSIAAFLQGRVDATLTVKNFEVDSDRQHPNAVIDFIYVSPTSRRTALGSKLVCEFAVLALGRGCSYVAANLAIDEHLEERRRFFSSLGFRDIALHRPYHDFYANQAATIAGNSKDTQAEQES